MATDLVVPALGESITEAVISRWMKAVGDRVEADEPVLELESDKVTLQLPAPVAGTLGEQRASEGATVKVGEIVGVIEAGAAAAKPPKANQPEGDPTAKTEAAKGEEPSPVAKPKVATEPEPGAGHDDGGDGRRLSPSMRRAQREGAGPAAARPATASKPEATARPEAAAKPGAPAPRPSAPRPAASAGQEDEVVPMTTLRKRIAARLVEAQHSAAALTTFNEVDMSAVMALRETFQPEFVERHGVKLGFMSFFAKAAVEALRLWPGLNAEIRGDSIVYKRRYDLGVAVSTERGLIVPVLRGVDRLGFADIEQGIAELANRARGGKLAIEDLTGGTFTITNGGIYGSMMSTPLLNHPQTGILGMHNIVERAVVVNGAIEVRPMMYLALTYDHRVVDGKEAVSFLVAVKQRIEKPDRLLLGV